MQRVIHSTLFLILASSLVFIVSCEKTTEVVEEVPFDNDLFKSYAAGKPVVSHLPNSKAAKSLKALARKTSEAISRIQRPSLSPQ